MKLTDLFIRRPVIAIVVNVVILVGGLQALRSLSVRQYPRLESATVTVRTAYVGANADLVRGFITTPLERSIAAADGIDYIESQSTQGLSTISVRLQLNFPAADALADISARVNQVRADLPPEAEVPTIGIEPSDAQIAAMYLSFGSNILEDNQLTDYLIRVVQPRLSAIKGVQRADILGGRAFAIRAWLKADRMAALHVTPAQVRQALAANNFLSAVGQTKGALVEINLTASTDLRSLEEFKRLVIRREGDTLVRLSDVAAVELVIASTASHEEIIRFADALVAEAAKSGQFAFPPISDVRIDQQRTDIVLDRDKVAAMGLTMQEVGSDLAAVLGGDFVNRFNMDGRSYKVIPQLERAGRLLPSQLEDIHIGGPDGQPIPLGSVASLRDTVEPRTLNRFQQLNAVKLSGIATRSLDGALAVLEDAAGRALPVGYRVDYTGESRQLRQEGGKFLPALGLALLMIFLVLAAQFNSFRDPFVILAGSVPLALFGALIFTFLKFTGPPGLGFPLTAGWTTTMNIYSQVGLVTLVGLIAKNGILIVEFANVRQLEGRTKIDAVKEAASTRLRPILMTTAATVAGHFPLTLVTGPGAAARNSIGVVLVGGMALGTLFTLFVVPAVYVLLAKDHRAGEQPGGRARTSDDGRGGESHAANPTGSG